MICSRVGLVSVAIMVAKRLLLVVVVTGLIFSASVFGLQALTFVPKWLQPILILVLGVFMLAFVTYSARPERRAVAALLLSSIALTSLFAVRAGFLTVAELTHIVCFGGLGMALGPARPGYAIATLAVLSTGDEMLQALLPYRTGSIADVGLNLVSALLFYSGWRHFGRGAETVGEIDGPEDT